LRPGADHAHADCGAGFCKASAAAECSRWRSPSCWRAFLPDSTAPRWPLMASASSLPPIIGPHPRRMDHRTATPGAGSSTSICPSASWPSSWFNLYVEDPPYLRHKFKGAIRLSRLRAWMALWLGTLQFGAGQRPGADWFAAPWICWTAAVSALALIASSSASYRPRTDRPGCAILPRPQLRRGNIDHLHLWLCPLWRNGICALVSANSDGLLRPAKRPGQPVRAASAPWLRW